MENFETTSDPKFLLCIVCKAKLSKGSIKSQLMKHLKTSKHLKSMKSDGMTKNFEHLEESAINDDNSSKRKLENLDLKNPKKFKSNEVLSDSENIIYNAESPVKIIREQNEDLVKSPINDRSKEAMYFIPNNLFASFEEISKQNRCNMFPFKHLETLAFLVGTKNSRNEIWISGKF